MGNSVTVINGKTAEYNLSRIENGRCLGGAGILLAKKWLVRVIKKMRASNRMIVKDLTFKRVLFQ